MYFSRSFLFLLFALPFSFPSSAQLQQVTNFGSNPGNLTMYKHVPSNMPSSAPLVVVLHGCSQDASGFSGDTEWNMLADRYKFHVVFAEQLYANNWSYCFNWFNATDQSRGQGEALSIKQMVDEMKSSHSIDDNRVFVSGLSAGGAMTAVMTATYPDVFSGGAVMAGVPYKAATSAGDATNAMNGNVDKTPQAWADSVTQEYLSFSGTYPDMAVFHGTNDPTVDSSNATELMEQWTALHNAGQTPNETDSDFMGWSNIDLKAYLDGNGVERVRVYRIQSMGHGIAVDPGTPVCQGKGGGINTYSYDVGFYSSYWAGRFFGIIPGPDIAGDVQVNANATGKTYSVNSTTNSSYNWSVPPGASITNGQGSSSITVDFGAQDGYVTCTETDSAGCTGLADSLFINISTTSIATRSSAASNLKTWKKDGQVRVALEKDASVKQASLTVLDIHGRVIEQLDIVAGQQIGILHERAAGVYLLQLNNKGKPLQVVK